MRHRRGLLLLLLLGGFVVAAWAGGAAVHYTETAGFCGRCHTMAPELAAFKTSPHKDVSCADCHVRPGLTGWVKAKAKGTRQLIEVVTGRFPEPIPAPDHSDLPPVADTCLRCHSVVNLTKPGREPLVIRRVRYDTDQANTREQVSVALRPDGFEPDGSRSGRNALGGVHGHVANRITYASPDVAGQTIDVVNVVLPDGTSKQFVSRSQAGTTNALQTRLAGLQRGDRRRVMDCLDCHNRVGHELKDPGRAVDDLIAAGKVDQGLPYVKRDAVALLSADYASQQAADQAIEGLRQRFQTRFPLVLKEKGAAVDAAIAALKTTYRDVASPAMKVQTRTYVDNLGHQGSPGCFRCHDGKHVRVVDGHLTDEAIPSTCATCHSFPQLGGLVSSYLPDGRPTSHEPAKWAVTHKVQAAGTDPTGTTCGACHTQAFCVRCHSTGAVQVRHAQILQTHPEQVARLGAQACFACHKPATCLTCHTSSATDPRRRTR